MRSPAVNVVRLARRGARAAIFAGLFVGGLALSRSGLESPGPSHLLLDREGRFLGEVAAPDADDFGYWPVEELPARVVSATLVLEDRRFWLHPGVDPIAVARALWQNVASRKRVSTLRGPATNRRKRSPSRSSRVSRSSRRNRCAISSSSGST